MSFDGIRPAQMHTSADPLSPYLAANEARTEESRRPQVKKTSKDENSTEVNKELPRYGEEEEEDEQPVLSEEETEQVLLFARMRGIMNKALEKGTKFRFQINAENGMVELLDAGSGKTILTMTPSDLMQLSGKIDRYAGVLTDRAG